MSLKALQDYTFTAKYANFVQDKNRRETWEEAVDRVKNMMLEKYSDKDVKEEIEWAYNLVKEKRVIGSQRAMQFGGKPILKHNARMFNCCSSYCDRVEFFKQAFYLLLCGCGVGFSVQKHHVNKLPVLRNKDVKIGSSETYIIKDSIESWGDALDVLIKSFLKDSPKDIVFDYSLIRKKGEPLSHGMGKAPGPEILRKALEKIKELLEKEVSSGYEKIRPIVAYDIIMHCADAVIAGGHRRSATIALFSYDDEEMMTAKTGNWFYENPQRGRSNNSVVLLRDETSFEQFEDIINKTRQFGEPGFAFYDSLEGLGNPCMEISFYAYDDDGNSGFQFCNLSEINVGKVKTEEDFYESCKAASIIGTLQAGFTSFPYLGEVSENITKKEALLGVSMTGVMENPEISLNPVIQKNGAEIVKNINKEIALKIGINPAARTTCIKPSGSAAATLGVSSGIHPHHYKRYIRRVQANKQEGVADYFYSINPVAVEESVWSNNGTDVVISFCCECKSMAKTKNDLSAIEFLENVKNTQINWVMNGKNKELCNKEWLEHNVSNTCLVRDDEEWKEVTKYIYDNKQFFTGISLLSSSGDKDYPQAPFTAVYLPSQIAQEYGHGSILASGLIERGLKAFNSNLWVACDAAMGFGYDYSLNKERLEEYRSQIKSELTEKHEDMLKIENQLYFIDSVKRFAQKYMDNDIKKTTYLLKDVYNWKSWSDLKREYKDVDYVQMTEETDSTNFMSEPSCAGGACEL
jgi:ribonucleoside-triphosphate reductase (thioredoxin)